MQFDLLNALYQRPLFDLISESRAIYLEHWRGEEVQHCSLLSIKSGGCSEDCAYCAQSARYSAGAISHCCASLAWKWKNQPSN